MTFVEVIQKKLREAQFFLRQLEAIAGRSVGNPEEFEFLLSAFLSASRSITEPLNKSRKYKPWYDAWHNQSPRDRELLELLREKRNAAVHHKKRAVVEVTQKFVPIIQLREQSRGHPAYYGFHWSSPPGVPPPEIGVNVHYFKLGDTQKASEKCRAIVTVLNALVADFAAAYPGA